MEGSMNGTLEELGGSIARLENKSKELVESVLAEKTSYVTRDWSKVKPAEAIVSDLSGKTGKVIIDLMTQEQLDILCCVARRVMKNLVHDEESDEYNLDYENMILCVSPAQFKHLKEALKILDRPRQV